MEGSLVVLDHNFPRPIVAAVAPHIPDLDFRFVAEQPGALHRLSDRELIYELHRRACPVFVTQDHHMLDDVGVLVAIEQTRVTVVAIEDTGHDPIRGTGVLLRDLSDVVRENAYRGLAYRVRPSRVRPTRTDELIRNLDMDPQQAQTEHGLPFNRRTRYPEGDERRLR